MASALEDEWDDWIRDWVLALKHDEEIAASTIPPYRRGISQFVGWLREAYPEIKAPGDITAKRVFEEWLTHLGDDGKSAATRRVRLMTLKAFYRWLRDEPGSGVSDPLPTDRITAPVVHMPHVPVVDDDTLRALLRTCATNTFVNLRDAAIIRCLISTGLRREELVRVDLDGLDINHGDMAVMGKGNKPRVVSISGNATTLALSRYLRVRRRHAGAAQPALFLSTKTTSTSNYRMTGGAVWEMLRRRCKAAGVGMIRPHQLRHSWADRAKRGGLSDEDLERMAGWSSPLMVRRYGRALAQERARDAHRNLGIGDTL